MEHPLRLQRAVSHSWEKVHFPGQRATMQQEKNGVDEKFQTNIYSFKSVFSQNYVKLTTALKDHEADHLLRTALQPQGRCLFSMGSFLVCFLQSAKSILFK